MNEQDYLIRLIDIAVNRDCEINIKNIKGTVLVNIEITNNGKVIESYADYYEKANNVAGVILKRLITKGI